jgi:hypothetical protein
LTRPHQQDVVREVDEFGRIRRLRGEYEAALDEAEAFRERYHREIVKLHRSGRSLREIAEGLGISHQRVHQIVSPAEPSAGRRAVRAGGVGALILVVVGAAFLGGRVYQGRVSIERAGAARPSAQVLVVTRCGGGGVHATTLTMSALAAGCERRLQRLTNAGRPVQLTLDARTGRLLGVAAVAEGHSSNLSLSLSASPPS